MHTGLLLPIADEPPLTVTAFETQHVGLIVYVIVDAPADTPVTTPEAEPTLAKPLLLVHVPPAVPCVNVVLMPTHIFVEPVIAAGAALTVAIAVARQPATVYEIVAVPAAIPVITPVPDTIVATPVVLDVQAPDGVALVNVDVEPAHTVSVPLITDGAADTVTTFVTKQPNGCV
jgi:hypothetical protein